MVSPIRLLPAYSWLQTDDQITISIGLQPEVTVSDISVDISPSSISAGIDNQQLIKGKLFSTIKASDSVWQLETSNDGVKSLSIHLEKDLPEKHWPVVVSDDADQIDPSSCYFLGIHLQSTPKAIDYFQFAAEKGLVPAMLQMAGLTAEDPQMSIEWTTRAANCGSPEACFALASVYQAGVGLQKSAEQATHWFEQVVALTPSSDELYVNALFQIGLTSYLEAQFVEARNAWQRAKELKHSKSIYNLGTLYLNGQGVEQDVDRGIEMMFAASEMDSTLTLPPDFKKFKPRSQRKGKKHKSKKPKPKKTAEEEADLLLSVCVGVVMISIGAWIAWRLK